jgi:hypothetical protein
MRRAGAEQAAEDPAKVEQLGREAEDALEGEEGDELRDADKRGKKAEHK